MEFLGVIINSVDMNLYLPEAKLKDITKLRDMLLEKVITLKELTSLIGKLILIYQTVPLAPLNYWSS